MITKYNSKLLVGWIGALTAIFTAMSACSDPVPPGGTGATGGSGGSGGSSACGNGVLDAMETCDTAIAAGNPGACPTACNDNAACTADTLDGAGTCNASCSNTVITMCQAGDGCCPSACDSAADSDCSATCGNGIKEANEQCDTAIAVGMPGSCVFDCNDGLACTHDNLLNAGTCGSECTHSDVTTCIDGDGCCPAGCDTDTDCIVLSRIRQTVITETGDEWWLRNGYWDGMGYKNWTPFTGQGLTQLIPTQPAGQTYRSVDFVVHGDGNVQNSVVQLDGKKVWSRYGTWDGSAYSSWTPFTELTLDLPAGITDIRSFDQVVFPDSKLKQSIVTWDGKFAYYRYANWDAGTKTYINWTAWTNQYGDFSNSASFPAGGTFRSFSHVLFADNRIKQALLSEDGHTVWYRYGTWDGMAYGNWTTWSNQYGNLTNLLPGKGTNQAYLTWDEAALAGSGISGGCQNGCDDNDPCTADSCVNNSCVHIAKSCDDGNLCTEDACVNGACQNVAKNCDDGQGCTVDSCVNGLCEHSANCDDGNGCTDDSCAGGSCQHNNNSASCGNGGTCQNGTCQSGGGSSSSGGPGPCVCTTGCKDSCGQPCNEGATCGDNATCKNGDCSCNGGPWCPSSASCCPWGWNCNPNGGSGAACCPTSANQICLPGICGNYVPAGGCPAIWCGNCAAGSKCCGNACVSNQTVCD